MQLLHRFKATPKSEPGDDELRFTYRGMVVPERSVQVWNGRDPTVWISLSRMTTYGGSQSHKIIGGWSRHLRRPFIPRGACRYCQVAGLALSVSFGAYISRSAVRFGPYTAAAAMNNMYE